MQKDVVPDSAVGSRLQRFSLAEKNVFIAHSTTRRVVNFYSAGFVTRIGSSGHPAYLFYLPMFYKLIKTQSYDFDLQRQRCKNLQPN
jgi:hypothetical protein